MFGLLVLGLFVPSLGFRLLSFGLLVLGLFVPSLGFRLLSFGFGYRLCGFALGFDLGHFVLSCGLGFLGRLSLGFGLRVSLSPVGLFSLGFRFGLGLGVDLKVFSRRLLAIAHRLGVFVLRLTGDLGSGDNSGRRGHSRQLLGERLDRVFFLVYPLRLAREGSGILAALRCDHDVHHGADEYERRRERVDPNARDVRGHIAAHQL